jgi:membrane protease YdiL (CAAX protease family)
MINKDKKKLLYFFILLVGYIIFSVIYSGSLMINSSLWIIVDLLFILLLCFCSCKNFGMQAFQLQGNNRHFLLKSIILCLSLYVLLMPFDYDAVKNFITERTMTLLYSFDDSFSERLGQNIPYCIALFLIAPVSEEILYRGLLQEYMLTKTKSPLCSILISAAGFALLHLSLAKLFLLFICGCFYGFVYYKYRNLTINIICHFCWNIMATTFLTKVDNNTFTWVIYLINILLFSVLLKNILEDKVFKYTSEIGN